MTDQRYKNGRTPRLGDEVVGEDGQTGIIISIKDPTAATYIIPTDTKAEKIDVSKFLRKNDVPIPEESEEEVVQEELQLEEDPKAKAKK